MVGYPGHQRFFLGRGENTFSAEGRTHERQSLPEPETAHEKSLVPRVTVGIYKGEILSMS